MEKEQEIFEIPLVVENTYFNKINVISDDGEKSIRYIYNKDLFFIDTTQMCSHPIQEVKLAEYYIVNYKDTDKRIVLRSNSPYFIRAMQVYSAKYWIAHKCNYYISELMNGEVKFRDVTNNIDEIYKPLADILQELENEQYGE